MPDNSPIKAGALVRVIGHPTAGTARVYRVYNGLPKFAVLSKPIAGSIAWNLDELEIAGEGEEEVYHVHQ